MPFLVMDFRSDQFSLDDKRDGCAEPTALPEIDPAGQLGSAALAVSVAFSREAKEDLPTRVSSSAGLPEGRPGEQDRPSSQSCCDGHHWEGLQCHVRRP
jgi:hypothetical protein